jgi:hypothetical protein
LKEADSAVVSPTALRPLIRADVNNIQIPPTPKSALKRSNSLEVNENDGYSNVQRLDKITFSPFNSVRIIPHRVFSDAEFDDYEESNSCRYL